MATIETTRPAMTGARFGSRLTAVFSTISTWNDSRATQKSLGKLSDSQLADIGLTRGNLDMITR